MAFSAQIFDKHQQNCLQKCFYMMNLIRNKSIDIWEMYAPVYETLQVEESWEFYHLLVDEYRKLLETPVPKKKASAKKRTVAKKQTKKK